MDQSTHIRVTVKQTGILQNTAQTNCPSTAPCSEAAGCSCPSDKNGDTGVLINQFTGYQCAYPHGACTWDSVCLLCIVHINQEMLNLSLYQDGDLVNTAQNNCVKSAKCKQSGKDS